MKTVIIGGPPIYLEALCRLLEAEENMEVAGTASDLAGMKRLLARTDPDVVLVNLCSSSDPGVLDLIRDLRPAAKLVVVGVENSEVAVAALARAGVVGYLTREATGADLADTVRRVNAGQIVCPPTIVQTMVDSLSRRVPAVQAPSSDELTGREREVVELMRRGMSNKQIASRLHIEVTTVKSHVHSILGKLNVRRRAEAIALLQNPLG
ncbi:MAG TPA: response regulator transcription factor [Solirubrobacteraceae bacterium]|nr:response regulator transcription factor [Solirubrobacteraceae bacterium]